MMKILIVGLGNIGKRHLNNLNSIVPEASIAIWRHKKNNLPSGDNLLKYKLVYNLQEALSQKPDAVVISNPAPFHTEISIEFAKKGAHLFIEKPLSNRLDNISELKNICQKQNLVSMVGFNFRFYRPFQIIKKALENNQIGRILSFRAEVGQFLPDWRPGNNYRDSVSARKELGGGAIFELCHEIDYIKWFVGEIKTISSLSGSISDLNLEVEDTADIIIETENGAVGSIHLDMVDRASNRSCRIIGTEGTLLWDFSNHHVRLFTANTGEWSELCSRENIDRNEMYILELKHFLDCIQTKKTPVTGIDDGRRVLEIALAIKKSCKEKRAIEI